MIKIKCKAIVLCDLYTISGIDWNEIFLLDISSFLKSPCWQVQFSRVLPQTNNQLLLVLGEQVVSFIVCSLMGFPLVEIKKVSVWWHFWKQTTYLTLQISAVSASFVHLKTTLGLRSIVPGILTIIKQSSAYLYSIPLALFLALTTSFNRIFFSPINNQIAGVKELWIWFLIVSSMCI